MGQFHGDIGDGKFGVMNEDQIMAMVISKANLKVTKEWKGHCKTAINKVLGDKGTICGDYKYTFDGVYHASSGVGPTQGCTLFYVVRAGGTVKLVGVGYHVGAQTYAIDWKESGWCSTSKITLDK